MQGLLRFAIEGSDPNGPDTDDAGGVVMTEDRRRWLEDALQGLSVNIVEELGKALRVLDPERVLCTEEEPEEMENALEVIIDYVDSIDTARDFHKIGGYRILLPCLASPHTSLRRLTGELIATLMQNNPYCQAMALQEAVLPALLKAIEEDADAGARSKALHALSCLVRSHSGARAALAAEAEGFSTLLRVIQSGDEKLRIKASFLLKNLCDEEPTFRDTFVNMGFVEQLVSMVQAEAYVASHEFVLSALSTLVDGHRAALAECRRPEFRLQQLLESRCQQLRDDDACKETVEYCQQLLSMVFSDEASEDR